MTETTYTPIQAAEALGLSVRTVQKLCKQYNAARHGVAYVITDADLARWEQRPGPGRPRTERNPAPPGAVAAAEE